MIITMKTKTIAHKQPYAWLEEANTQKLWTGEKN